MTKNLFGKGRATAAPYAIYVGHSHGMTWHVLKTYKLAKNEGAHSRWFVAAKSDGTFGSFELGDTYASQVKAHGRLIAADPEWLAAYDIAATVPTPAEFLA